MNVNWDLLFLYLGFGIVQGGIIALGAIGLSLLFKTVRFINFAYGDTMALGAFIVWTFNVWLEKVGLSPGLNLVISVLLGVGVTGLLGMAFHKAFFRPLERASPLVLLITSVGLAFVLRNAILFIWGPNPHKYHLPLQKGLHLGPFIMTPVQLLILVLALAFMLGVHLLLTYTDLGHAIRATADNTELAQIRGIDTERVATWVWFFSHSLAGLAGAMLGVVTALNPNMGIQMLLVLFAAVIMGGVGNPYGAMASAMIVGLAMEIAPIISGLAPYKIAVAYLLMVLVLLIRPYGLFAR